MANITGSFTGAGQSAWFTPRVNERATNSGDFNVFLSNSGTATLWLESTPDGGVTVTKIYAGGSQLYSWSYANTPLNEVANSCEQGIQFRLNCSSATGTVDYRLSGAV